MKNALVLFNQDLRISDNPAFFYAMRDHKNVAPIFILDEVNRRPIGQASKWFLHHALQSFSQEILQKYALKLAVKKGDSLQILREIFSSKKVEVIYFSRGVDQPNIELQDKIKKLALENFVEVFDFKSTTLFEPNEIKNGSGSYFKVFTPFWRHCLKNSDAILDPLPAPENSTRSAFLEIKNDDLNLLPQKNWAKNFEIISISSLENFLKNKVHEYKQARDIPALNGTSKLSPHLHFGLISAREIFYAAKKILPSEGKAQFLAELGWREFCHHLLFHFPKLPTKSFRSEFERFPWQKNDFLLQKWQKGQTGFPIVDAGMRELWSTGLMHNRVRMIVASFLVKDLLIDWREGEEWFWNCLLDADLASNVANWQWVAGSGADAAPYFRIFNPTLQGERFDADGAYVKKWLPELAKVPNRYIHKPWEMEENLLKYYEVELGKNYPKPIVDHAKARDFALMAFKTLK
jgi:deoxyribodipyrimidine photo-lyase